MVDLTGPQGIQGIQGPKGDQGIRGVDGIQGVQGVQGIRGPSGPSGGKDAYQSALDYGFVGTEQDWLASLKGEKGDPSTVPGPQGPQGEQGVQGIQGPSGVTQGVMDGRLDLIGYSELHSTATIVSGVLSLDLASVSSYKIVLNADITNITFSNVVASGRTANVELMFEGDGTERVITWPASVRWPNGEAPTPTSTSGKVDFVILSTRDGGTNWFASDAGQNF